MSENHVKDCMVSPIFFIFGILFGAKVRKFCLSCPFQTEKLPQGTRFSLKFEPLFTSRFLVHKVIVQMIRIKE